MEIVMRTATYWDRPLNAGDTANVPDDIGERWIAAGLAARPGTPEAEQAADARPDYSKMLKADLVELARDRGVEGYEDMTKADLVTALESTPAINEPNPADQQTGTAADVPAESRGIGTGASTDGGGTGTAGGGAGGGGTAGGAGGAGGGTAGGGV